MAAAHIDLVSSFVKTEAIQYTYNEDLKKLTAGLFFGDPLAKKNANDTLCADIIASQTTNSFISNAHIITQPGLNMYSTRSTSIDGILDEYKTTVEDPENSKAIINWIDTHEMLDDTFNMKTDSYIMSYQVFNSNNRAIIVIDISSSEVQEFINSIDLGEGCTIGFITPGGRELISNTDKESDETADAEIEKVFYGTDFYNAALADVQEDTTKGVRDVKVNGKNYLFFFANCEISGAMICALVPIETVTAEAGAIKSLTIALIIAAVIIVVIVGLLISESIRKNVGRISKGLNEVAEGDLTVEVKVKGNDEFKDLAKSATDMVYNTKKLVQKVDGATGALETSAIDVKSASDTLGECSKEISEAVEEITKGMARQSRHADSCVATTDKLSEEIAEVTAMVEKVYALIDETTKMIGLGVEKIETLGEQAGETTKVTEEVTRSIEELREESEKINSFVGVIASISSQTNLLSLNASIEAARAGDAGRGFAVVAEEIRKLADESAEAAGEISKLVGDISIQTKSSVASAESAQAIVNKQTTLVGETSEVFETMKKKMDALIEGLKDISVASEAADASRIEAVEAVRDISQIIGETAEHAETVMGVSERLAGNVENLDETATKLGESMADLKTEIEVFKI